MKTLSQTLLTALSVIALTATAPAQTIYSDPLTEYSSGSLNGDLVPNGSGAGTAWTAASTWNTTSSGVSGGAFAENAVLPFTPTAGNVYTLQATMTGSNGWLEFGSNTATTDFALFDNPNSLIRIDPPGNADEYWINGGGNTAPGGAPTVTRPSGDPLVLTITLDTTAPQWTTSLQVTDPEVSGDSWSTGTLTYPSGGNPTGINDVAFGSGDSNVNVWTNFSLSTPGSAPEPSTYALMLAGLGALVVFARRRTA